VPAADLLQLERGAILSSARSAAMMHDLPELPPAAFAKQDASDDLAFYAPPRLVTHIDEAAVAALTAHYRAVVPAGGVMLDLMSSWVSHLPGDVAYREVIGHGMNADELAANPRLDRWFVQDLNRMSALSLDDAYLDAALCCVGVQYLQQPVDVFAEVRRALKPGAPFIVTFSNRCFPTKAVAVWLALDTSGHAGLVRLYLERAGFSNIAVDVLADSSRGDPLVAVTGHAGRVEGSAAYGMR
jgi:SAM-dependent methyltransferase